MNIDKSTKIPLFTALGFLPVLVGGILWLTSIDSKASASVQAVSESQNDLKELRALMVDVRDRLIRLETKINK